MEASTDPEPAPIDHERACRYATRIVGDGATAEDMVQEARLRVSSQAPGEPGSAGYRRYFYRALTNLCLDELERSQRGPALGADLERPTEPARSSPDALLIGAEEVAWVRRALDRLPARQRAAVVLKEWEGLSYREIGGRMGISESNAATLVYRGMSRLRADRAREVGR